MKTFKYTLLAAAIGVSFGAHAVETLIEDYDRFPVTDPVTPIDKGTALENYPSADWSSVGERSWKVISRETFDNGGTDHNKWGDGASTYNFAYWDWSDQKVVRLDVQNATGVPQQVTLKIMSSEKYSTEYVVQKGYSLNASLDKQTIEVHLEDHKAEDSLFNPEEVHAVQVVVGGYNLDPGTFYFDNLRVDDLEDDGGDNGTEPGTEILVDDFEGYAGTENELFDNSWGGATNTVVEHPLESVDGKAWHIEYSADDDQKYVIYRLDQLGKDGDWSNFSTLELDVVNTSEKPMQLLARLESTASDVWDQTYYYSPEYLTITAETGVQTLKIDLDADHPNRGENFTKSSVDRIRFVLTVSSGNYEPIYIDSIRANNSIGEAPDDGEDVKLVDFSKFPGGIPDDRFVDNAWETYDYAQHNRTNSSYSSNDDGYSWEIDYEEGLTKFFQLGSLETKDFSEFKTFEVDVLNETGETVNALVRLVTGEDWNKFSIYKKEIASNDEGNFETLAFEFMSEDFMESGFDPADIKTVQFTLANPMDKDVTLYWDNLRISNRDGDTGDTGGPGEPGEGEEQIVQDFESANVGAAIFWESPHHNEVVYLEDEDTKAGEIIFNGKNQSGQWGANIDMVKAAKVFKIDVKNTSASSHWVKFEIAAAASTTNDNGVNNCWSQDCNSVSSKNIPNDGKWHTIEFEIAQGAGSLFKQDKTTGFKISTPNAYSADPATIYINNLRVGGELEGDGDHGDNVINTIPEYKDEGGSFGIFSFLLMPLVALFRRRK
ncbi:GlyGly-CTERM sorting domain-containing protein [Vibrio sp. WXL103]|uniref:GlyGly-CTERM sorting domain-containing protein n=1 Tax=Vibrio sp. WXL103 TaxID=3450710 RepID=UPI003EC84AC7